MWKKTLHIKTIVDNIVYSLRLYEYKNKSFIRITTYPQNKCEIFTYKEYSSFKECKEDSFIPRKVINYFEKYMKNMVFA